MKILLIDNSSLTPIKDELCCEPKTGLFAKDLVNLGNKVTMYGQIVKTNNTIHSFEIKKNGIMVKGIKRLPFKLLNYLRLYLLIIPLIREADFVYIFYPSAFKYTAFLSKILNKPYGLYIRGELGLLNATSKYIYNGSSITLTVTESLTHLIKSTNPKSLVSTIKPMISFNEQDIAYTREYNNPECFKILFLARIEEDKGIKELLMALATLKIKGYSFTLDIVGDGGYLNDVKKIIDELNIKNIVNIKGSISNKEHIRSLYLNSDLYVLPTHHEGFPRTLYEAMIFGTPIITTFVGAIPSIMKDHQNCIEAKPKSVESLVNSLEFALLNYSSMVEYAKNGFYTVAPIIDSAIPEHSVQLNKAIRELLKL